MTHSAHLGKCVCPASHTPVANSLCVHVRYTHLHAIYLPQADYFAVTVLLELLILLILYLTALIMPTIPHFSICAPSSAHIRRHSPKLASRKHRLDAFMPRYRTLGK